MPLRNCSISIINRSYTRKQRVIWMELLPRSSGHHLCFLSISCSFYHSFECQSCSDVLTILSCKHSTLDMYFGARCSGSMLLNKMDTSSRRTFAISSGNSLRRDAYDSQLRKTWSSVSICNSRNDNSRRASMVSWLPVTHPLQYLWDLGFCWYLPVSICSLWDDIRILATFFAFS